VNHYFARKKVKKIITWLLCPFDFGSQSAMAPKRVLRRPSAKAKARPAAGKARARPKARPKSAAARSERCSSVNLQGLGKSIIFSSKFTIPQVFFFGTCHGQGLGLMLPFQGIFNITF
jgi:hypothetical protein